MDLKHLASVLDEISLRLDNSNRAKATSAAIDAMLIEFEEGCLELMVHDALDMPGHVWEFWNLMARSFAEFNTVLQSNGDRDLKLVPFDTFKQMVQSAAARREVAHV